MARQALLPTGDSMESMSDLIVRRATADDIPALARLIDGFAKGHPAEGHIRSVEMLRDAFFGSQPIAMFFWQRSALRPSASEPGGRHTICSGPSMAGMALGCTYCPPSAASA